MGLDTSEGLAGTENNIYQLPTVPPLPVEGSSQKNEGRGKSENSGLLGISRKGLKGEPRDLETLNSVSPFFLTSLFVDTGSGNRG